MADPLGGKGAVVTTFKEVVAFVRASRASKKEETGERLRQIQKIIWHYHAWRGLTPERATALLEALGPTFVKIGQIASNRSDIIPPEYAQAFQSLRADVPPMPFETVEEIINKALGHPWQQTFASIDPVPLGSASIAQVHKAVIADHPLGRARKTSVGKVQPAQELGPNAVKPGTVVAIKVQRPSVANDMLSDLALMRQAVALFGMTGAQQGIKITVDELVDELDRTTRQEIDFTIELHNLEKFHALLADQENIESPLPYPMLSSKDVLVMEYISGPMINDKAALKKSGDDLKKLAHDLTESYITQVVDNGFFHADPHPGNILVNNHQVCWIDLGMVGTLTSSDRGLIMRIMEAAVRNDAYDLMGALLAAVQDSSRANRSQLLQKLTDLLTVYLTADLADINMGLLFTQIIDIMRRQNLVLPSSWTLLARSMITFEGVIAEISPQESILAIVTEHVHRHELSRDNLKAKFRETASNMLGSAEASIKIPEQIEHSLDMLNRGEITMNGNIQLPQDFTTTLYSVAGTLALALIAMGLFIGSSIVCTTGMSPKLLGVPFLGVFGYIGAFILSAYVVGRHLLIRHKQKNHEKL